jgi:putative mycofactocin binding protein MftB
VTPSCDVAVDQAPAVQLTGSYRLAPRVALRPEPFGALAYNYDNRRLVFLRSPDIVAVVSALGDHADVAATLEACGISPARWSTFLAALSSLESSEVIHAR